MIGAQTIYLENHKNIKFENVTYDDTVGPDIVYGSGIIMPALNACAEFEDIKVVTVKKTLLIMCNYLQNATSDIVINKAYIELNGGSSSKIVDGDTWENAIAINRLNLTLRDVTYMVSSQNPPLSPIKKRHGRWLLDNVTFVYNTMPTNLSNWCGEYVVLIRGVQIRTCRGSRS